MAVAVLVALVLHHEATANPIIEVDVMSKDQAPSKRSLIGFGGSEDWTNEWNQFASLANANPWSSATSFPGSW